MLTNDSKNILIADDALFFRIKLSDILCEAGHKVILAQDGKCAIEEIKADPGKIDLLILDLQMPEVDGFGVLRWINENGLKGKFPVIAVTGVFEPSDVICDLRGLGAKGFMSKDLAPEQIVFRVNRILFFDKAAQGIPRERVPVSIPVDFTFGGKMSTGTLLNISESGAFMHTDAEFITGALLEMHFSLPDTDRVMHIKGTIRWAPYESPSKIIFCGYGIMFTSISHEDQERLNDFIASEVWRIERLLND